MSTVTQILKRNAYVAAAGLVAFAAVLPSVIMTQTASAGLVTQRSVKMSTSKVSATSV